MPLTSAQLHSLLASVAAEIGKTRETGSGLTQALELIAEHLGATGGMILRAEDPTTLRLAAQIGDTWDEEQLPAAFMDITYAEVFRYHRATLVPPNAAGYPGGVIGAPLTVGERQIGGIFLIRGPERLPFDEEERDTLQLICLALAIQIESREESRRTSARRAELEAVHSSMVDGLLVVDVRGYISTFNETFKRVCQVPSYELYGLRWSHLIGPRAHPTIDAGQMMESFMDAMAGGEPFVTTGCPAYLKQPDGVDMPVTVGLAAIEENGKIMGGVINVRDATVEAQLERLKDDFIATVSHELKTPLTTISGFVELVRNHELPRTEVIPIFDLILDECRRLGRMITDLLDLSKIQSGLLSLHLEKFSVAKMVEQAVRPFRMRYRDTHTIKVEITPPSGTMVADRDRIVQILVNLVGNAVKYSPAGGEVTVKAQKLKSEWEFTVADQGMGIPEAALPRLFGRFFRVNEQQSSGSGLGLFITKSLVERHGGRISVTSQDGVGSTFLVRLPATTVEGAVGVEMLETGKSAGRRARGQ
ncbi:MAG: sensor histidine kinase [Cyanobacteria bacterium RYN_339]|nr:sensor histidine kinase [Cyanobacteria bacterium RYN_339]